MYWFNHMRLNKSYKECIVNTEKPMTLKHNFCLYLHVELFSQKQGKSDFFLDATCFTICWKSKLIIKFTVYFYIVANIKIT